jgi:hypothetical protein
MPDRKQPMPDKGETSIDELCAGNGSGTLGGLAIDATVKQGRTSKGPQSQIAPSLDWRTGQIIGPAISLLVSVISHEAR